MVDPEIAYKKVVSGDAARIRSEADVLEAAARKLRTAREDITEAAAVPVWSGDAAKSFVTRVGGLDQGLGVTRGAVVQARHALDTAATAYASAVTEADAVIETWRNRETDLVPAFEAIYAVVLNAAIVNIGKTFGKKLSVLDAALTGQDLDLDALDEETRKWVEEGLGKNDEWLKNSQSLLGPLIPNTAATGDDRGLIPQGLGYDPATGTLVQGYYQDGGPSYLALIDETSGREIGEVKLGGSPGPNHAGGVSVDGDNVYVFDNGAMYTYSMTAIQSAGHGETVPQSNDGPTKVDGGSYSAVHGNKLYLGDFENDRMYVYERGPGGQWVKVGTVPTPNETQGVLVRDGEYVFSTSYTRHQDNSSLYVQDFDGNRSGPYELPSMSQGIVEVDGELIVTYESGAEKFDSPSGWNLGKLWGVDDYRDLWANPYMTRTPLSELGLKGDFEVDPPTLKEAGGLVDDAASRLITLTQSVRGAKVPQAAFGDVPHANTFATTVNTMIANAADSLRTGVTAMNAAVTLLDGSRSTYVKTDDVVGQGMRARQP
ncbi:hypothetical protein N802_07680 [Knoellia sinensis KCTC 19936]|uniref:Uncharacterized protein n=1 Tax=Knoellia sinensis KCTC 19936 TaxID=1385520 RepID=A0A0A0J950_9MICO|nr:hypothetical protein [Knoellia sinensis]KGN33950.1 hypothetical protein N802_07680 [Knoellia sinensis KCTC 19936]